MPEIIPEIMPEIVPAGDAPEAPDAVAAVAAVAAAAVAAAGDGKREGADMTAQLRPRSSSYPACGERSEGVVVSTCMQGSSS